MTDTRWIGVMFAVMVVVLVGCSETVATDGPATARVPEGVADPTALPAGVDVPTPAAGEGAAAGVSIAFDAVQGTVADVIEATVSVADVEDLFGAEIHLSFDAEVLEVTDLDDAAEGVQVADGDLLSVAFTVRNQADNAAGTIDYAVSQMPPSTGVTGSGTLVRVQFRAKAPGTAGVQVTDILLANSEGNAIPASLVQGATALPIE